jgi:hypothetical protein
MESCPQILRLAGGTERPEPYVTYKMVRHDRGRRRWDQHLSHMGHCRFQALLRQWWRRRRLLRYSRRS